MRIFALPLIAVLIGTYGYRAAVGLVAGRAYVRGVKLILQREYEDAPPFFEKAAVGFNRFIALRRIGDAEIDHWEYYAKEGGPLGSKPEILEVAAKAYMESLCASPAARNPWEGLGLVYSKLEWIGREQRSEAGFVAGGEPWSKVGYSGRVSLGMLRRAVSAAPNWYLHHDWLVRLQYLFGLDYELEQAVRAAAEALPLYYPHEFARKSDYVPLWVKDVFYETSLESVGKAPLLPPGPHLVDLGKQARGRQAPADAIDVLTRALQFPGDDLVRAETRFHLGLAMVDLGRDVEGRDELRQAATHPAFREAALLNLARVAEQAGDHAEALGYYRQLRRDDPRELDYCLQAARLARVLEDWPVALEALQWGKVIAPSDPKPLLELAETHLEMGDVPTARAILRELEAWDPEAVPESLHQRVTPE
jgi:tetratricopeptide (TPR) repeat protein